MTIRDFQTSAAQLPNTEKMPVLFVGHGSPMNLVEKTRWSEAWRSLGAALVRPQAILCISAHWFVDGTYVHVAEKPRTIYDFYGFPDEMYRLKYDCPGSPAYAEETRRVIATGEQRVNARADEKWGIDHGTWLPLFHMFPQADVPTFQLSIDYTKPAQFHYDLAKSLALLRRKGVLIIGSGNVVHNLGVMEMDRDAAPYEWAQHFDQAAAELIANGNHAPLIGYERMGTEARLSVPTPDHYFPMLSALALQEKNEALSFFTEGMAHGSVSMRSFVIGG